MSLTILGELLFCKKKKKRLCNRKVYNISLDGSVGLFLCDTDLSDRRTSSCVEIDRSDSVDLPSVHNVCSGSLRAAEHWQDREEAHPRNKIVGNVIKV